MLSAETVRKTKLARFQFVQAKVPPGDAYPNRWEPVFIRCLLKEKEGSEMFVDNEVQTLNKLHKNKEVQTVLLQLPWLQFINKRELTLLSELVLRNQLHVPRFGALYLEGCQYLQLFGTQ